MVDDSYVATLNTVSWSLGAVILAICSLRLWGRMAITKHAGWDDVLMACATVSALVCSALVTVGTHYGLGRHKNDIAEPRDRVLAIKYTVVAPNFSIISSSLSKASILVFLVRLMGVAAQRSHLCFLWGLCLLLVALNISAIFVIVGFCIPAEKIWNPEVEGWCMSTNAQLYVGATQSAYNALMDIIVAIFPTFIITKLSISRKMKIGLCILMGGGIFAAAATIVKVYLIKDLDKHADITWAWAPITLWYTAEASTIMSISLSQPLADHMYRWTPSSSWGPYRLSGPYCDRLLVG